MEPLEEVWLFRRSGFSACVPEFLTDSAVWPLDGASCPKRTLCRFCCHTLVIRHQSLEHFGHTSSVSGTHRSSVTSREESRCGSQWEQGRAKLPVLISNSGFFFCLSFILVRGPVEANQPRPDRNLCVLIFVTDRQVKNLLKDRHFELSKPKPRLVVSFLGQRGSSVRVRILLIRNHCCFLSKHYTSVGLALSIWEWRERLLNLTFSSCGLPNLGISLLGLSSPSDPPDLCIFLKAWYAAELCTCVVTQADMC